MFIDEKDLPFQTILEEWPKVLKTFAGYLGLAPMPIDGGNWPDIWCQHLKVDTKMDMVFIRELISSDENKGSKKNNLFSFS